MRRCFVGTSIPCSEDVCLPKPKPISNSPALSTTLRLESKKGLGSYIYHSFRSGHDKAADQVEPGCPPSGANILFDTISGRKLHNIPFMDQQGALNGSHRDIQLMAETTQWEVCSDWYDLASILAFTTLCPAQLLCGTDAFSVLYAAVAAFATAPSSPPVFPMQQLSCCSSLRQHKAMEGKRLLVDTTSSGQPVDADPGNTSGFLGNGGCFISEDVVRWCNKTMRETSLQTPHPTQGKMAKIGLVGWVPLVRCNHYTADNSEFFAFAANVSEMASPSRCHTMPKDEVPRLGRAASFTQDTEAPPCLECCLDLRLWC